MTQTAPRPATPRIPPLNASDLNDRQRVLAEAGASNVIRTLVRHPDLLEAWLGLGGKLLFSQRLTPRERELVVLRVARRTACTYEWANHVLAAVAAAISADEIRAILSDGDAAWSASEAALLRAVDELCADNCIADATWSALSATRDDLQLIELLLLVGFYRMNAGMLNSLGVQPEPGRPGFGEIPAAPPAPSSTSVNADEGPGYGAVEGTWQVTFHHPSGDQNLTLVLHATNGVVSGSVSNAAVGVTLPITDGHVATSSRFSFTAPMTTPVQVDITYAGVVRGDAILGNVTIAGGGAFPFDGARS
jgi:AhpD family alkylhydroperoxidase